VGVPQMASLEHGSGNAVVAPMYRCLFRTDPMSVNCACNQ
jgi:hypothetical protein